MLQNYFALSYTQTLGSAIELICTFHRNIRAKAATGNHLGPFELSSISNSSLTNGSTYEDKGHKTVWEVQAWTRDSVLFRSFYLLMQSPVSNF